MQQLTVGIIGAGLITQVEHLPNLLALPERFRVVGVTDPSAKTLAHLHDRYGVATFATADALLAQKPDCILVATPDSYHADLIIEALGAGCHVFTEKPLCYDVADARRVQAARDAAKKIVQIGYMKRFDPAYVALRAILAKRGGPLRAVTVDVIDSDAWAYTAHRDLFVGDDVPQALIDENRARRTAQVNAALGVPNPKPQVFRGFAGPFCSSLVHDINVVQGLLAALDTTIGRATGVGFIGNGELGGTLSAQLDPSDAVLSMTWVAAPKVAYYSERISLIFEDAVYELRFPSPYLNHQPTELIERRSDGHHLEEVHHRPSYAEPFVEELKAWHAAITEGGEVRNTVEQATRDLELLAGFARLAL
jgi:predicted dehydrogenase